MILEKIVIALVLLGQFQNFKKCTLTIYPKNVITSANYLITVLSSFINHF